jgi:hypothetical protein
MVDGLTPLAHKIMDTDPHAYETLVARGGPSAMAREMLDEVQPEQLLDRQAASPVAAYAMLAGLWLWHDGLDECHHIVQKSPGDLHRAFSGDLQMMTSTLAFWHAIMHRREGDFSNSKYWYARAAGHPVLQILASQAGSVVNQAPADKSLLRLVASGWNPNAFVDLVESLHTDQADARHSPAVRLQQLEWKVLFEFCARQ